MNKTFISGNIVRDPELRSTANGFSVLVFCLAVNDRRKNNKTGEWEDKPNFIDCKMFGTRAEKVHPLLYKGCKVVVEGKLDQSTWEKDGQKHSKLEVIVDQIEIMKKNENRQELHEPVSVFDEDIPF